MKILILAAVLGVTTVAQAADDRHYQIKKVYVRQVQDTQKSLVARQAIDNFTQGCEAAQPGDPNIGPINPNIPGPQNPIDIIDVIVDKIINIGKKIWAIVDAGRPVVNIKVDTANALPAGVRCWDELEGWNAPQSHLYQVDYENGFGSIVVSYGFRVSFISGGSYKGKGQYITLASVTPANVDVSWGFKLDAVATVPMVFNQGSKQDPLAGMQLVMDWKVESPLTQIRRAENFFVNGKGQFQKLK